MLDTDPDRESSDANEQEKWCEFVRTELAKPVSERWEPPLGTRLASDLYGSEAGKTAFIIGCGPSIKKAEKRLMLPIAGSFRIALNRAIDRVPAEYWFFMDEEAYSASKDSKNRPTCEAVGADRYWKFYDSHVYVWRRAFTWDDVKAGRLAHRSSSLCAAIHFAIWLGATRIVTVGTDNRLAEDYSKPDRNTQLYTYARVNDFMRRDLAIIKPTRCSVLDASEGGLHAPKTALAVEVETLKHGYSDRPAGTDRVEAEGPVEPDADCRPDSRVAERGIAGVGE